MDSFDLKHFVVKKIEEVKVYHAQGMDDIVEELLSEIYSKIKDSNFSSDDRKALISFINQEIGSIEKFSLQKAKLMLEPKDEEIGGHDLDPESQFEYAKSLMEIHNWEEAIKVLETVAASGYKYEACYELCGDCAFKAGDVKRALKYYETVYSVPGISSQDKKRILDKIVKCHQKKLREKYTAPAVKTSYGSALKAETTQSLSVAAQVEFFSSYIGQKISSWVNEKGQSFSLFPSSYRLRDLLHVGNTWAVFEAFCERDGFTYAALKLVPKWEECLSKKSIIEWVYISKMMDSKYLSIPEDLAVASDGSFFVIRPYYSKSLIDYLGERTERPYIEEACLIAYQILDGLGYLHLHMGKDKGKRKIYHLDLRPSRIFFADGLKIKLAYGGLWSLFIKSCPNTSNVKNLPLSFLSYRAPEQFRSYLWSIKKPLVCTDIYQFGVLFYELLTGVNPFVGDSVEEIEILHCDQKPVPPQVIRTDIPEELNSLVMECLHVYPGKRWRSTTQVLLIIEKFLGGSSRVNQLIERKKREI